MKTYTSEKSLNVDPDDKEKVEGDPDIVKDMVGGYASSPKAVMNVPSSTNTPPVIGKSLFTSVTLSKSGGACAVKPQKQDKDVIWASGKSSPEKLREEPEGEYVPEGWSPKGEKEDDKKKKSVKKSIIERRYGSQLARTYDIGKSCGVCGRVSKSCNDHNGCCEDCKKSMNITLWHDSHLS